MNWSFQEEPPVFHTWSFKHHLLKSIRCSYTGLFFSCLFSFLECTWLHILNFLLKGSQVKNTPKLENQNTKVVTFSLDQELLGQICKEARLSFRWTWDDEKCPCTHLGCRPGPASSVCSNYTHVSWSLNFPSCQFSWRTDPNNPKQTCAVHSKMTWNERGTTCMANPYTGGIHVRCVFFAEEWINWQMECCFSAQNWHETCLLQTKNFKPIYIYNLNKTPNEVRKKTWVIPKPVFLKEMACYNKFHFCWQECKTSQIMCIQAHLPKGVSGCAKFQATSWAEVSDTEQGKLFFYDSFSSFPSFFLYFFYSLFLSFNLSSSEANLCPLDKKSWPALLTVCWKY